MKVALYYNRIKIRIVTPYLFAEYPTSFPNKAYLADREKLRPGEISYSWDAIGISNELNAILSNMTNRNNFVELPEIVEIFNKYSEIARKKASLKITG